MKYQGKAGRNAGMGLRLFGAALAVIAVLAWGRAMAAERVALIIGNDTYLEIGELAKAVEDANGYREFFRSQGYRVIGDGDGIAVDNLDRRGMLRALQAFYGEIGPGTQAVFIYSGHGWSDGTRNMLIPVDAPRTGDISTFVAESIVLQDGYTGVLDTIRARGARLSVAIIDACRDNPFQPMPGTTRNVGLRQGLVDVAKAEGTFVMFSAGAGQTALDRLSDQDGERFSVFTRNFLPQLYAGKGLREAVLQARIHTSRAAEGVDHKQVPAYYDEVIEPKICLAQACGNGSTVTVTTKPDPVPPPPRLNLAALRGAPIERALGPQDRQRAQTQIRMGDAWVEAMVGTRAEAEAFYKRNVQGRIADVTYRRDFPDAAALSGFSRDGSEGYYGFILYSGDEASVVLVSAATNRSGKLDKPVTRLMGEMACSTTFRGAGLPCAKK